MNTKKYYYDKATYIIENNCYHEEQEIKDMPFIELTFDEWCKKMSCGKSNYVFAYINGEIVEIPNPTKTNDIKREKMQKEINTLKMYLNETDYVITKLNESKIEDTEQVFNDLKLKYSDTLTKRKNARNRINELEKQLV